MRMRILTKKYIPTELKEFAYVKTMWRERVNNVAHKLTDYIQKKAHSGKLPRIHQVFDDNGGKQKAAIEEGNQKWNTQLRPLLERIGHIKVRRMFGTYTIFVNDLKAVIIAQGKPYFRITSAQQEELTQTKVPAPKLERYYQPRLKTNDGVTNYFAPVGLMVGDDCSIYLSLLNVQLIEYAKEKAHFRLKDGFNITLSMERMLKSVGIRTLRELEDKGAVNAFLLLREKYPVKNETVLKIEAAIRRVHWKTLPKVLEADIMKELESKQETVLLELADFMHKRKVKPTKTEVEDA